MIAALTAMSFIALAVALVSCAVLGIWMFSVATGRSRKSYGRFTLPESKAEKEGKL